MMNNPKFTISIYKPKIFISVSVLAIFLLTVLNGYVMKRMLRNARCSDYLYWEDAQRDYDRALSDGIRKYAGLNGNPKRDGIACESLKTKNIK